MSGWARLSLVLVLLHPGHASAAPPKLLPMPREVREGTGDFALSGSTKIRIRRGDEGAATAANYLRDLLARGNGLSLKIGDGRGAIRFLRKPGYAAEAYAVESGRNGVTISASTDAGLLYGAVTTWQLASGNRSNVIPAISIRDAPSFRWRGLMLDSARHFQSPEFVKRMIDWMAVNKLNIFHWHLVDDQGWRLEIKKYPRLTEVSAWRVPATAPGAPPLPPVGGYYTQDQVREIVAYAAARNITVVPEIEMPGHALSAIRAYPQLGTGARVPPGSESDWGVFPWLYNVDDGTLAFLEDVLTETMALFPSGYIHVGGDEAVKDQWKASPQIQARMKALGLKDEQELQSWFMSRIGQFLAAHGRTMIGWDEILEGGIPRNATIMSWQGTAGAIAAAKAGHDSVLSPAPTLYFDNRQGFSDIEPPGRGNFIDLATVYGFNPLPPEIALEQRKHVLGVQGNLWTEHLRLEDRAAWNSFPRASAVAEVGWSNPAKPDFGDFIDRLVPHMRRMGTLGLAPAASAFAVHAKLDFTPPANEAAVSLSSQSGLEIRYTLDGSEPTNASPRYASALELTLPTRLRAAAFHDGAALPGAFDRVVDSRFVRRRSDEQLRLCAGKVPLALEDDYPAAGPRAVFVIDIFEPCWIFEKAPVGGAKRIALEVGQIPFNFQVGKDVENIHFRSPATLEGEFEVRAGCDGERIAVLPLAPASKNPGVTRLVAPIAPSQGKQDLCITYTAKSVHPLWAVDGVELLTE